MDKNVIAHVIIELSKPASSWMNSVHVPKSIVKMVKDIVVENGVK